MSLSLSAEPVPVEWILVESLPPCYIIEIKWEKINLEWWPPCFSYVIISPMNGDLDHFCPNHWMNKRSATILFLIRTNAIGLRFYCRMGIMPTLYRSIILINERNFHWCPSKRKSKDHFETKTKTKKQNTKEEQRHESQSELHARLKSKYSFHWQEIGMRTCLNRMKFIYWKLLRNFTFLLFSHRVVRLDQIILENIIGFIWTQRGQWKLFQFSTFGLIYKYIKRPENE